MGAPLYAELMRGMAADWLAGGVVREICAGWEGGPEGDVVQLRFLGGLHRLVLTGQAPELVAYYRTAGGELPAPGAWQVAAEVVAAHADTLRADLAVVPQTNEVGRSAALVTALSEACAATGRHRIRLLEVGASAGLNLLADAYRIGFGDWWWGPEDSPVVMEDVAVGAVAPVEVEIVGRRGCDLHPVDPRSAEGALRLRSFVWPDHVARYHRLVCALDVAAATPVEIDAAEATPWLREQLASADAVTADPDVLTVVWHSVVWQYLTPAERAAAEDAVAEAATRIPLAHAQMEPEGLHRAGRSDLTVTTYDAQGVAHSRILAEVPAHGFPVRLR